MSLLWLIEGIRSPLLNQIFQFITYFGQELFIITVICILYWCVNKRFAYQLGFTYFTAGLCVQALKITFRIPRPWVLDPAFQPVDSAVGAATGYSFPSGHTQGGTSLFAPLAFQAKQKWLKILCILAFLLIAFSRMYLGVHTPKDVLVSIGISLFFSWLVFHFQEALLDSNRYAKWICALLLLASLAVSVYALTLLNAGTIDLKYASDCCKAAGAGFGFAIGWYIERTYLSFHTQTKTLWGQILKLFIGLGVALFIKSVMKSLFGPSIFMKMFQYFLLVLWVLVIYPYCFTKLRKNALQ